MKTLKTILVMAMGLMVINASAQTADEIIGKYVKAMGGAEKLASLKTVKMEGTMSTQGIDVVITMTKKQMSGLRMDMDIMGTANFQLANTTKGWVFMPVMQQAEPQEMDADQVKSVQSQFDIQGILFNYKEKGYQVQSNGVESLDGKEAYKLQVVKNADTVFYFIDKTSNFIVKNSTTKNVQGADMTIESSFSDYKQNDQGFWFAYTNSTLQGEIKFDKISTNIEVDDKIFTN
jgi:hypothetical protein